MTPMAVTTWVQIGFDPDEESASGSGWILTYGEDLETESLYPPEAFTTLTLAAARQQDLFSESELVNAALLGLATAEVIADNQAAIDSELAARRTAEGLDATMPP